MRTVKARLFTENTIDLIKALRACDFSIVDDIDGSRKVADGVVIWFSAEGRQYVCPCFTDAWFDLRPLGFEQDAIHMASVTLAGNINALDRGWHEGVVTGEGEIAAYIGANVILADYYHGKTLTQLLGVDGGLRNWDFEGDELNMLIPGFKPRNPVLAAGEAAKETIDRTSHPAIVGQNKFQEMAELFGFRPSAARQEMHAGHQAQLDTRPLDKLADDELVDRYLSAVLSPGKDSPILKEVTTRMGDRPEFRDRILGIADRVGVAIPDVVKNMSSNAIEGEKPSVAINVIKDEDVLQERRRPEVRVLMSNESIIKRLVGPWDGPGWDEGMGEEVRLKRIAMAENMNTTSDVMVDRRTRPTPVRDHGELSDVDFRLAEKGIDHKDMDGIVKDILAANPPKNITELLSMEHSMALARDAMVEFVLRPDDKLPEGTFCTSAQLQEGESAFDAEGKRWTKVHGRMVPEGMVQKSLSSIHLVPITDSTDPYANRKRQLGILPSDAKLTRDYKPFPDIGGETVEWSQIEDRPGVKALLMTYTQKEICSAATWIMNEAGPVSEASYPKLLLQVLQVHYPKPTMHPFGYMSNTRDIESNIFSQPVLVSYLDGLDKLYDSAVECRSAEKALKYPESVEETRSATRDLVNTPSRKLMGSDFEGEGGAAQARMKLRPEVEETINRFADPESVEAIKAIVNKDEPKN